MRRTGKRTVNASLGGDFDLQTRSCVGKTGPLRTELSAAKSSAPGPPRDPEIVAEGKSRS